MKHSTCDLAFTSKLVFCKLVFAILLALSYASCKGQLSNILNNQSVPLPTAPVAINTISTGHSSGVVQPRRVSNYTPEPNCDPKEPFTLAQEEQLIIDSFNVDVLEVGEVPQPGVRYVTDARVLIIYYTSNCELENINYIRSQNVLFPNGTIQNPNGYQVDATYLTSQLINPDYASWLPNPLDTQNTPEFRQSVDYLAISRYISAKYSITLVAESYYLSCNAAMFMLSEIQDSTTIALLIQRQNNDIVMGVLPNYILYSASFDTRYYDPQLDDYGKIGSGILSDDNGPEYWDTGKEEFDLFQVNAHPLHAGFYISPNMNNNELFTSGYPNGGITGKAFVLDTGCIDIPASQDELPSGGIFPAVCKPVGPNNDQYWWDLIHESTTLIDENGHGTGIAGIISARGGNFIDMTGVIPYGTVYPFRIQPANWNFVEGTKRALLFTNNYYTEGPHVINLSYYDGAERGMNGNDKAIWELLEDEENIGNNWIMVCCAGNGGLDYHPDPVATHLDKVGDKIINVTGIYPAALAVVSDHFISVVGYTCENFTEVEYQSSNFPIYQDNMPELKRSATLGAPAEHVMSILKNGSYGILPGGTSFAAPFITSAVATLQSYNPTWSATDIRSHLENSGRTTYWNSDVLLPEFGPWDNHGIIVPILDIANSTTWIAITSPERNAQVTDYTNLKFEVAIGVNANDDSSKAITVEYFLRQTDLEPVLWATTSVEPYDAVFNASELAAQYGLSYGTVEVIAVLKLDSLPIFCTHREIINYINGLPPLRYSSSSWPQYGRNGKNTHTFIHPGVMPFSDVELKNVLKEKLTILDEEGIADHIYNIYPGPEPIVAAYEISGQIHTIAFAMHCSGSLSICDLDDGTARPCISIDTPEDPPYLPMNLYNVKPCIYATPALGKNGTLYVLYQFLGNAALYAYYIHYDESLMNPWSYSVKWRMLLSNNATYTTYPSIRLAESSLQNDYRAVIFVCTNDRNNSCKIHAIKDYEGEVATKLWEKELYGYSIMAPLAFNDRGSQDNPLEQNIYYMAYPIDSANQLMLCGYIATDGTGSITTEEFIEIEHRIGITPVTPVYNNSRTSPIIIERNNNWFDDNIIFTTPAGISAYHFDLQGVPYWSDDYQNYYLHSNNYVVYNELMYFSCNPVIIPNLAYEDQLYICRSNYAAGCEMDLTAWMKYIRNGNALNGELIDFVDSGNAFAPVTYDGYLYIYLSCGGYLLGLNMYGLGAKINLPSEYDEPLCPSSVVFDNTGAGYFITNCHYMYRLIQNIN